MSEAPERVWIIPDASGVSDAWACGWYQGRPSKRHCVEYVRADLPPTLPAALAVPEVAALVEALEAAEESIATFIGVHQYPMDSGAGDVLRQVCAALRAVREAEE